MAFRPASLRWGSPCKAWGWSQQVARHTTPLTRPCSLPQYEQDNGSDFGWFGFDGSFRRHFIEIHGVLLISFFLLLNYFLLFWFFFHSVYSRPSGITHFSQSTTEPWVQPQPIHQSQVFFSSVGLNPTKDLPFPAFSQLPFSLDAYLHDINAIPACLKVMFLNPTLQCSL